MDIPEECKMKWKRIPAKLKLVERKTRSIQFKVELQKKINRKTNFCSTTTNSNKEEVEKSDAFNIIETFIDAD